jgi:hypothetical protein
VLKFNYLARIAVSIFRAFTAPTAKMKIQARPQGATDAVTVAGVGLFSASRQAANTPKYGQGWGAYGERFASTAADGFSDIMIGGAIRLHGCSRIHATSIREQARPVPESAKRCSVRSSRKEDNGKWQPTYSSLGRDLASSALANLYYPPIVVPNWCSEILRLARLNGLAQAWPRSSSSASSPEGVDT